MKTRDQFIRLAAMLAAVLLASCASSYQDRLDALGQPQDEPAGDVSEPAQAPGITRDDLELTGACIVSAECKSGEHCELGRCVSRCDEVTPCSDGLYCSARGRCVSDSAYVDVDPPVKATPPASWSVDEHVIRLGSAESGAAFSVETSSGSLSYRVQVEPEGAVPSVTLSTSEGVIGSGGSKSVSVGIKRADFGEGEHRVSVAVVTDAGQKNVMIEFSNGYSGRYAGFVEYRDPGLGRVPLIVDIKVDGSGQVQGRTVEAGSLLFPDERSLRGQLFADRGEILLSVVDVADPDPERDPFMRSIGREISFMGETEDMGVIKGEVEEVISGLMPSDISVTGLFYLTRVSHEVPDFTSQPDPIMPGFVGAPPASYTTCEGVSASCTAANFAGNMIFCSDQIRSTAFRLGEEFAGTDLMGEPYVDFGIVEQCRMDMAQTGDGSCVDIGVLECMRENQERYVMTQPSHSAELAAYFTDLNGFQRLHALAGNDSLVTAYRTSIHEMTSPLTQEMEALEDALASFERAERAFFGANNMLVMSQAQSDVVAADDYEVLRVPLQYIRSSHVALTRLVSLGVRRAMGGAAAKSELRRQVQQGARAVFLEGVVLARLVTEHGGSFGYELAQITDELGGMAVTVGDLEAELNPLGFTDDYVPFIYDPTDVYRPTNFQQLVQMASASVQSAVQKAEAAESEAQLMEVRTEEIEQRMLNIEQSYQTQLVQLCGVSEIEDIHECGSSGGELAQLYAQIEEQYLQIERAQQAIMDLNELVKIKNDSALQIAGIKGRTIRFTQASGATLEALDIAEGEIRAAMLRKSGLFGSIGGFFSGVADLAGGVFSGFIEGTFESGNMSVGGIAGGASGLVNAGLGAASAANSAAMAQRLARVAAQKRHITNLQELRRQEEGMELAALEAEEQVKSLLIQMAQLNLELELQHLRLEKLVSRVLSLLVTVDHLMHQREVLAEQAAHSVQNPMSNLSFRLKRDHSVLLAAGEFERAIADVYLAARGLEHELNVELPQIESQLMQAGSAYQLRDFLACVEGWYDDYRIAFGSPHEEVTQISLREDILGFTEPVTDEVTGEVVTPQEIFRRVLLAPKNITSNGRVQFPFSTGIYGDNKQFSTLVCNDRIKSVKVQLVGDFLGDNEATVMLRQEGDSFLRDCAADPAEGEDIVNTYHLDPRTALVQAGVNSFGIAQPSYDLAGRSVASDRWVLIIPKGSEAPNNADVDFLNIDDVIVEITHTARTLSGASPSGVFDQCNI